MLQLYTKYRDGVPVAYRYGDEWVAMQLYMEGGYPTPEEAIKAWEAEIKTSGDKCNADQ